MMVNLLNRLMHPSNEVEREYAVRVMGEVTPQIRNNMLKGVDLKMVQPNLNHSLKLAVKVSTVGIRSCGERRS